MYKYKYIGNDFGIIRMKSGLPISSGFNRIVHGGRGAYVEFTTDQMLTKNLLLTDKAKWRLNKLQEVYYVEFRVNDYYQAKVYFQLKPVDYADYMVGMWYISPRDLQEFVRDGEYSVDPDKEERQPKLFETEDEEKEE